MMRNTITKIAACAAVTVADTTKPVWTESYTIDKSALGDDRIRLTWTWEIRNGLIISFY